MKITAGTYRGRSLFTPKGKDIRPTSDKVRHAVFNMLASRGLVQEARVIDAFCGTGALGLEALSQGAAFCTFIDRSRDSLGLCKANVEALGVAGQAELILKDCTKIGPGGVPAGLVFFDPPYGMDLIGPALEAMKTGGRLTGDAVAVIELGRKESIDPAWGQVLADKEYGDTRVLLVQIHF